MIQENFDSHINNAILLTNRTSPECTNRRLDGAGSILADGVIPDTINALPSHCACRSVDDPSLRVRLASNASMGLGVRQRLQTFSSSSLGVCPAALIALRLVALIRIWGSQMG